MFLSFKSRLLHPDDVLARDSDLESGIGSGHPSLDEVYSFDGKEANDMDMYFVSSSVLCQRL